MRTPKINKQKIAALAAVFAVVASPAVASAAADTDTTTVTATVNAVISIASSSTVGVTLTPTGSGVVSSNSDTVTVSTNNPGGYNLVLEDSDANTNLAGGTDNIAAHSATWGSATALANNTWGYAIAGATGFDGSYSAENSNASSTSLWVGVPASGSGQEIKDYTSGTATNDTTTVWYGVRANTAIEADSYVDTVTYTATTN